MTREEFDEIMFRTLLAMGDPTYVHNDPSWDKDYEKMKLLSPDVFGGLGKVAAMLYKKDLSKMVSKKIIFTRALGPRYHYIATFLRVEPESMEWDPTMRYPICIPLKKLKPTQRYGPWILMGIVGLN